MELSYIRSEFINLNYLKEDSISESLASCDEKFKIINYEPITEFRDSEIGEKESSLFDEPLKLHLNRLTCNNNDVDDKMCENENVSNWLSNLFFPDTKEKWFVMMFLVHHQ